MAAATSLIHGVLAGALITTPPVDAGRTRLPVVDLGDPQELVLPANPATLAGQRHADAGHFDRAAAHFEALARSEGDVRLLYHAGSMRAKAGQYALAARHFQALLERAGGLQAATRAYVDRRLAAARAQLVAIRIQAIEAAGGSTRAIPAELLAQATVRLETVGGEVGSAITLANYRGEEVFVDRTPVVVHLAIPGYAPVSQLHHAGAGGAAWDVVVARQKVTVDLRFAPERALRKARLRIQPIDGSGATAVDQALESPAVTVQLTTGSWQIDVAARRHEAHSSLQVTPGMRPVTLALQRPGRSGSGGQELSRNDVMAAVTGGMFVLTAATGLGLMIAGAAKEGKARRRNEDATMDALLAADAEQSGIARLEEAYPTATLYRDLDRSFNRTIAGGVVTAASLGAVIAGVTVGARLKRRALFLEMGVGALLAGGGAAWLAYTIDRQDRRLTPGDPEDRLGWTELRAGAGHRAGASVVLGLGAGLVVFPAITLIADAAFKRRERRRGLSLAPTFGRDRVGLALAGRF